MIDSPNLTQWLTILCDLDSQLSQFAQVSAPEDREQLEEAIAHLRFARIALATGLANPTLQNPYLRVLPGGKSDPNVPF